MDLETRFKNIVLVLQGSNSTELTSMEIAKRYLTDPGSSDALTTGTILKMMSLLGYVERFERPRSGKSTYVKYKPTLKINGIEV